MHKFLIIAAIELLLAFSSFSYNSNVHSCNCWGIFSRIFYTVKIEEEMDMPSGKNNNI
ncbi:hypothetical protein [Fusobacterium ulcerans]|uniref:hypothetical protein n=1 Tax=Fusobacterium ulcerans TaxID=861 RepID=UPI00155946EE|nr:hypothetical protein [Fusobacterium ulcerans]